MNDIISIRVECSSNLFAMHNSLKMIFFLTLLAQIWECGLTVVVVPLCHFNDLESDAKGRACI